LRSRLIIQVHDEFVFEVVPGELQTLKTIVKREMERPIDFYGKTVTFRTELKVGKNWGDLK
jgi:DNA polymerase-1